MVSVGQPRRDDPGTQISTTQRIKLAIVSATGLSKDALHIYAGLAVFLAAAVILRTSPGSAIPWLVVLAVALTGELLDMCDDITHLGYWRWRMGLHDLFNTVFWPTVFWLLVRFGILF
jgi:hypothetical protein